MDAAARGATALNAGNASLAVTEYTAALRQNPQAVTYYIQRSIAYTRSQPPQHGPALADAEAAVVLAHQRAKSELIAQAQLRRAISLYSLGRYADCRACLDWSERRNKGDKSIPIWRMKVQDKLAAAAEGDEVAATVNVKEMPDVDVDEMLGKMDLEKEKKKNGETGSEPAKPAVAAVGAGSTTTTTTTTTQATTFTPPSKIRHDWYQSNDTVTVSLLAKGVPRDAAAIDIQPGAVSISYPLPSGADFDFSLEPLFAPIVPAESRHKIMSTKVEFVLKKATPGQKWHSLEGTEPIVAATASSEGSAPAGGEAAAARAAALSGGNTSTISIAPSYPTSSRTGPKNWDKVVSDLSEKKKTKDGEGGEGKGELDDDDDDEGGDDVNNFFKKLYRNADPDTQRAMMKSYQESNGTALSTNWNEVAKKTFDTTPPDGMEAKKW